MNWKKLCMDYLPIIGVAALIVIIIVVLKYRPDGFQTQNQISEDGVDEEMCSTLRGLETSLQKKLGNIDPNNKTLAGIIQNALDAVKVQLTNQGCRG